MAKSRRNRKSLLGTIKNTGKKALPVVSNGLKTVGSTAKNVAVKSAPVVEKGVSVVYGTLEKGFDYGITGAKKVVSKVGSMSKKRGGRRRKTNRRYR